MIGTSELLVVLLLAILLFGPKGIPKALRQLGVAYRELLRGLAGEPLSRENPSHTLARSKPSNS